MELKDNIYIIVNEALKMNKAETIYSSDKYLLINDNVASIYYIVIFDKEVDVAYLIEETKKYQNTVCVVSLLELNLKPNSAFKKFLEVEQYSLHKNDRFLIHVDYEISKVTLKDLSYIKDHYMRIGEDDEYLKSAISRGMLKAHKGEEIMGFIGEHPEHALGMLYVDEDHRRKGIGRALEQTLINKFLDEGKIPFDHVVKDNNKSKSLQDSLGMTLDKGYIYWYF